MTDQMIPVGKTAEQNHLIEKRQVEDRKLKKACADFEAIFVYQLLQSMRKTVPKGGLLPLSAGRSTWEMLIDQHIAEAVSQKNDGLGLQKMLYNDLKKKLKYSGTPPIIKVKE